MAMGDEEDWFEVWADRGIRPPYLLLLLGSARPHVFEIFDPQKQDTIHTAPSYQEAMFWLTEDEYERVGSRVAPNGD
jgi:hypothetical protein